jgi:ketosteroid isomerase-like protein
MFEQTNADEVQIKALLKGWAEAVRRHDLTAILAHHERDMVMFDLPPPLQCRGIEAYERTWDLFFCYHKPGTAFDFRELAITAGAEVGFAAAIMWCGPDSSSNPMARMAFCSDSRWACAKLMATGALRTSITPCLLRTESIMLAR